MRDWDAVRSEYVAHRCGCGEWDVVSVDVDEYSELWLRECNRCGACWEYGQP